jgi:hypothetical protein
MSEEHPDFSRRERPLGEKSTITPWLMGVILGAQALLLGTTYEIKGSIKDQGAAFTLQRTQDLADAARTRAEDLSRAKSAEEQLHRETEANKTMALDHWSKTDEKWHEWRNQRANDAAGNKVIFTEVENQP